MPDADSETSTATHRTRRVPDWRMPGPKNLINAGIQVIERTPSDKSIKIMCMRVDKNKTKCWVPVSELAQPHTGPGMCRFGECRVK
jgi:hypothetical protein